MTDSVGLLGFNGEAFDPVSGTYRLGNGYRTYSPAFRQFLTPDSMSPFGAGGINPCAYCASGTGRGGAGSGLCRGHN